MRSFRKSVVDLRIWEGVICTQGPCCCCVYNCWDVGVWVRGGWWGCRFGKGFALGEAGLCCATSSNTRKHTGVREEPSAECMWTITLSCRVYRAMLHNACVCHLELLPKTALLPLSTSVDNSCTSHRIITTRTRISCALDVLSRPQTPKP